MGKTWEMDQDVYRLKIPITRRILRGLCIGASVLIFISWARGADSFALRSRYLGGGRFLYELQVCDNPWIKQYDGMAFDAFTNAIAVFPVPGWTNTQERALWTYSEKTNDVPVPLPYPQTLFFEAHSSNIAYRLGSTYVVFIFSHQDQLVSKAIPVNFAGFAHLNALVPCVPAEADGAPDTYFSEFSLHEDITIKSLVMVSNRVQGLSFAFPLESTVVVQGSSNSLAWTNIAYALGNPGITTWTSSVPIEAFGPFYRILLYSTMHRPEMVE